MIEQTIACPKCKYQITVQGDSGERVEIICPKCGAEMPKTMKFCGNCGSALKPKKINCPKCKTENLSTDKFCGNCGTKLG